MESVHVLVLRFLEGPDEPRVESVLEIYTDFSWGLYKPGGSLAFINLLSSCLSLTSHLPELPRLCVLKGAQPDVPQLNGYVPCQSCAFAPPHVSAWRSCHRCLPLLEEPMGSSRGWLRVAPGAGS